jgi:hypothetical protein
MHRPNSEVKPGRTKGRRCPEKIRLATSAGPGRTAGRSSPIGELVADTAVNVSPGGGGIDRCVPCCLQRRGPDSRHRYRATGNDRAGSHPEALKTAERAS